MKALYPLLLALGAAATLYLEWHTDEATVVLAFLLIVAAALGFVLPRAALVTGLVIGLVIPLGHLGGSLGWYSVPAYQGTPPATADWLVMAILVLPAIAAAYAGGWVSRGSSSRA